MYGYSYACAAADVWHKVDFSAMLYPAYFSASKHMTSPSWVITCVFTFACCVVQQQLNCMNATAGARCGLLTAGHLVLLCILTMQAYL